MCFYVCTLQRIYLSSDDINSDRTLVLLPISMEFLIILMFVLTLADGLCCDWFLHRILCWCRCPEVWASSIEWAQLSRFHLKTESESNLWNTVLNKKRRMHNAQKHNSFIPLSQTFRCFWNLSFVTFMPLSRFLLSQIIQWLKCVKTSMALERHNIGTLLDNAYT
jgi:hypothetical protein